MKIKKFGGLLLLLLLLCPLVHAEQESTFRLGGITRTYKLYLPEGLPADAPLVFVLHGYGGSANLAKYGMNREADLHGFAVCYPQGERDGRGKTCWNAGYPFQADMTIDDVRFLCELARHLQKRHQLSRHNTFCTGMSNGGEMCYILAAQRPDVFAAVAPISGLMMQWLYLADRSQTAVPLFEIHGTADVVSVWEGDLENAGGWGEYLSIPLAIHYWVAKNRCIETQCAPLPGSDGKVIAHKYLRGTNGTEVWLYECRGGTHNWHQDGIDTAAEIWKFFSRFLK